MAGPTDLSIRALTAAYRAGELHPPALIDELYARIEADGLAGEWIHLVPRAEAIEQAAALAARPDAATLPLFGIPFGVKDNIDVAGMPTTAGCAGYAYLPEHSAQCVQPLLQAGALCLGKLNLDQFATGLVGSRSPYGAARNVFNPDYVAGGSSSGSAVAVAAHHVSFSLATDTAGSGRVPPALNNLVGLKPSVGRISNRGVVPACASIDCVAIFALCVADAAQLRAIIEGSSPRKALPRPSRFRFGIPSRRSEQEDDQTRRTFERTIERLAALGGLPVKIDFTPFAELGDLLYGPFVWERYLAVGPFIEAQPDAVLPVTRDIILGAKQHTAADLMRAVQRARQLTRTCLSLMTQLDVLALPTVVAPVSVEADRTSPLSENDRLGVYTRFANFCGFPVLVVPQDFRDDGLPSSVSLVGHPGKDEQLDALGAALHEQSDAGMGKSRAWPPTYETTVGAGPRIRLAVVGAHMRGLSLNHELTRVGARFLTTAHTAASYRLFLLPGAPERPGLLRVKGGGASIEVELWELTAQELGELLAQVPPPLGIGSLRLQDDELVHGFLCEASACESARDISQFGGYRRYSEQQG